MLALTLLKRRALLKPGFLTLDDVKTLSPKKSLTGTSVKKDFSQTEIGPLTSQLACLDFSVARGGALVAYRYHTGDKELFADRFVAVDALPE